MHLKPLLLLLACLALAVADLQSDIGKLHKDLSKDYWSKSQKYRAMITWQRTQGLYSSQIHFNIVSKKNKLIAALQRQRLNIPDENMFVTNFVLFGLLEASDMGGIELSHQQFRKSLITLTGFRDRNLDYGIPQYNFWSQALKNNTWSSYPKNLFSAIELFPPLPKVIQGWLYKHNMFAIAFAKQYLKIFCIPPDTDDSSVNIALMGYLHELDSEHYPFWHSYNYNVKGFMDRISYYAYRPFDAPDNHPWAKQLDPRSYFIVHKFLKQKKEQALRQGKKPSLILPTTWIISYNQTKPGVVVIPINANNVDASVNANFLFGLLSQIKSKSIVLNNEQRQMIRDITDFLVYVIEDAILRRADLVLLYYPSVYDFYWFVARNIGLLERMNISHDPDLTYVYQQLSQAMRAIAIDRIIKNGKENSQGLYWTEFLGNFANKTRNQDAIYSTALVINALLDTWGVRQNKTYQYLPSTPSSVKKAVSQGVKYLRNNLKAPKSKMGNAFFSGSLKILYRTYPYFFPANVILDEKNKTINAQNTTFEDLAQRGISLDLVEGYIEDETYLEMVKMKWFQAPVPIDFYGYNQGTGMLFPYWSAPAITRVMMITALSKYKHVQNGTINESIDTQ